MIDLKFTYRHFILYNLNIYFVVVYIVLSIISLHSVKNILTANYGEGVKHVKEENLVDSSIIQDFIYNPDLVKRQKNENRYYYFPQRLRLLFFSAFKNEFYFSITIIFFFLFYEYINTYFTFFELLTANRSYVLLTLNENPDKLKNLEQLKELRKDIKVFAKELVSEGNEDKNTQFLKQSETVFSEATWVQFLFILKFWVDDNSAKFESTDIVIEKSVNTVFDLFDNTPLERVIDLGKFLWKEKMN